MTNEWTKALHAEAYLARMKDIPHRDEGEAALLSEISSDSRRVLDLGCGNGHLLSLVLAHCPGATGVALDFSPTMLEKARERFGGDGRVTFVEHNMDDPLPDLGSFDCVVSSFAIHHCTHARKRQLYTEIFTLLESGGVFCNLEHVSSPTRELHIRFLEILGSRPEDDDPSNKLLDVETQLCWLRAIGFEGVDCFWKWRELALLSGRKPSNTGATPSEPTRIKQVVVLRHDLKMRRGKQIAQGAHAAMSFICRRLQAQDPVSLDDFTDAQHKWLTGSFAKVCCRVNSEPELMEIHDKALDAGLEVHLITDSGKTEFHGVPTRTCLSIGPDDADKIDAVTGCLELL